MKHLRPSKIYTVNKKKTASLHSIIASYLTKLYSKKRSTATLNRLDCCLPNTRNNLVIQSYEQIVPSSYSNVTNPLFGVILRPFRGPVMTGYRSSGFVSSQRPSGVTWGLGTCESFITSTRIGELYGTCRAKLKSDE
ncbi:hypothetical protein BY458DRAFT_486666 [Sporodiniella umbellata]|nr:hypothetical protein BY458DRAFT_486666 [Sporodiniella umbellata]